MEGNQLVGRNKVQRLLSRNQLWRIHQWLWWPFTGPSKSWTCPLPGIHHCLGSFCHCCTPKHSVGSTGGPSPPFPPSPLPLRPDALQGHDGWGWAGGLGAPLRGPCTPKQGDCCQTASGWRTPKSFTSQIDAAPPHPASLGMGGGDGNVSVGTPQLGAGALIGN